METLLNKLRQLWTGLHFEATGSTEGLFHEKELDEYALLDKIEQKEADVKVLQFRLTQARTTIHELRQRPQELRDIMAVILKQSTEELRCTAHFDVWEAEEGGKWETVTEYCCLGGCEMGIKSFSTERDTLLYAALLKAVGYEPPRNIACPTCYAEYMKDCI